MQLFVGLKLMEGEMLSKRSDEIVTVPDQAEPLTQIIDRLSRGLLSDVPYHEHYYDENEDFTDNPDFDLADAHAVTEELKEKFSTARHQQQSAKNQNSSVADQSKKDSPSESGEK